MNPNVPAELKYAKSHEWFREDGTVGITDHAQHELTDVVFVELPTVGKRLKAGEACAVVESVKTASDIYAPVAGEVVEVNQALESSPGLINTHPFSEGWIFKLKVDSTASGVEQLMNPEAYKKQIGG